jgi:tetratricopeptide (TPR) repeat protein
LLVPVVVFASTGGSPSPANDPSPATGSAVRTQGQEVQSDAERLYGYAYQEVAKAQKDLDKGNVKKARKRFDKAMRWCETAVEYAPDYHEAWNLVGFTARKLDDYEKSLAAYEQCLELKPNYVPAREYLGEALVEVGRLDDAREQLRWLERLAAKEGAEKLAAMIDAAEVEQAKTADSDPVPQESTKDDE